MSVAKNYCLVSFLFLISKVFEILVKNTLVDPLKQCGLISSMVSGLFNQLQIFSQLYLIELMGLLIGIGLIELWQSKVSYKVSPSGLLHELKSNEILDWKLALFCPSSVIDGFRYFWWEAFARVSSKS